MISYKYWVFYLIPKYYDEFEESLPIVVNTDTFIYAYTDVKEYADQFEAIHNMKYFERKKFDMTAEQVHDLTLMERNKYMKLQSYATKFEKGVTSVDLIITLEERYAVEETIRSILMRCSLKLNLESPDFLSGTLKSALKKLRYHAFWEYQWGGCSGSPFDATTFGISVDELSIYTNLFGVLLKGGDMA